MNEYSTTFPACPYCGNRMCGMFSGSTICEPDGYNWEGLGDLEKSAIREDWGYCGPGEESKPILRVVNLTPHSISLRFPSGVERVIEPTMPAARVASSSKKVSWVNGLPVHRTTFGEVENLPVSSDGTVFIVSTLVLGRCRGRRDVFAPGTGPQDGAIRNEQGQVVAVTRLVAADE